MWFSGGLFLLFWVGSLRKVSQAICKILRVRVIGEAQVFALYRHSSLAAI